jgi:hypothetical protein
MNSLSLVVLSLSFFMVSGTKTPRYVSYIDTIQGWWPDTDILQAWGTV